MSRRDREMREVPNAFQPERLLPACLKCGEPIRLNGQSQGYLHNDCVGYPESEKAKAFRLEQEERGRRRLSRTAVAA